MRLARGKSKYVVSFPEPWSWGAECSRAVSVYACVYPPYMALCLSGIALPLGTQIGVHLCLLRRWLYICVHKYMCTPVFGV